MRTYGVPTRSRSPRPTAPTTAPGPAPRWVGLAAVVAAAVLWGTTGTTSQYSPESAGPLSVGAARIVLGGALLLAWAAGRRQLTGLLGAGRWKLILAGAVAVAAYQLCFFAAVDITGVAVGTVVAIGSGPVLAGLLTRLLHGTPLSSRWLLATLAAVAGCAVLVLGGASTGVITAGVLLALAAGAAYASYAVIAASLITGGASSTGVMGGLFGGAGVLLLPVLLATDPGWLVEPAGAVVAVHLALVTTAVAYTLYGFGLRSVPVATAATLALAEPGAAALLGLFLLGEPARTSTVVGLGLLAAALVVLAAPRKLRSRRALLPRERPAGE
ncbi:DME family drug/metabolite transporter [Georgenia soli]|uniref:DME family drug/metabolite transporter n=1 Tax=Georgenia soli TaxID=638953 RepID=A0A2A9EG51_9MICO|nr:DME family drug/metabolite transporter [Georgenia soli]